MDNTYVSKDNGLTWTKRVGNSLTRSVYGGRFVDVGTSLSLITKRNQRTDGSSISPDVITIGGEGSTTVIGSDSLVVSKINVSTIGYGPSNTLSIASNVNVSMGSPTTSFSFTQSVVILDNPRIAYGAGKFVLAGDTGRVYYSTNGISWTAATNISFPSAALRTLIYAKDRFFIGSEDAPVKVYTSTDGITWNSFTPTGTISNLFTASYGNDSVVCINSFAASGVASITSNAGWTTGWSTITFSGASLTNTCFGTMVNTANGTNVFLIIGKNNFIRRNEGPVTGTWSAPTTSPSIIKDWYYVGFGNDTFVVTSSENNSFLTISRDAGKTWSTPINFGISLRQPIYVEGEWYIASDDGFIAISKNNGLSWEIIGSGINSYFLAYGNGLLVSTSSYYNSSNSTNNVTNLIGIKKTRADGSLITSDSITIGAPITPLYTYPVAKGCIGEVISGRAPAMTIFSGNATISTLTITTPGVYMFFVNQYFVTNSTNTNITWISVFVSTTFNTVDNNIVNEERLNQSSLPAGFGFMFNLSGISEVAYTGVYNLKSGYNLNGGSSISYGPFAFAFKAVRIA